VSAPCPECERQAEHCHGTLVRHADGHLECTDPACSVLGGDRHGLVVACADLSGCACEPPSSGSGPIRR
jgi:hypothetical protein